MRDDWRISQRFGAVSSVPGSFLLSATNPENGTVTYNYGTNQKIASKTDAKGQQTQYTYDTYQRLIQVRHYIGGSEDTCQQVNFSYDSNPYGSYSANVSGRLAAVQYKNATTTPGICDTTFQEWYSYDDGMTHKGGARTKKRLRVIRNGVSTAADLDGSYMYDTEGRMTSQQYPNSWALDTYGNPTAAVTGPSLAYTYDAMGRLAGLTENGSNSIISSASTSYTPAGQLQTMSGAWGTETRSYNAMLQMTGLSSGPSPGTGVSILYNYSPTQNNGKIVSQQDTLSGEQVTYAYDSLNRLARATGSGWDLTYGYDGFGNLTDQAGTPYNIHTLYDASMNRVSGECSDANGNVGGCTPNPSYSYDVENRIMANGPVMTVQYGYAPDNKRVWRSTWSGGTRTLDEATFWSVTGQRVGIYDLVLYGGSLRAVTGPANPGTGTEYYFGGKLLKNAGGYVHADRLGSIGKYYPYGQERPSATANGTEKFGTYFRDADTGLDYAVNRYESPGQGRFLSVDPSGKVLPLNPGSWNRYAYAGEDPVNNVDPDGAIEYCAACGIYQAAATSVVITISPILLDPYWNNIALGAAAAFAQYAATAKQQMAQAQQELPKAVGMAEWALSNPDCANLFGTGKTAGGGTVSAAEVLFDLFNGIAYGSISVGAPPSPTGTIVSATTSPVVVQSGNGPAQQTAEIVINGYAGSFVSGDWEAQAVTILHELGHAMNDIFGPGTSIIQTDSTSTNGVNTSMSNTALVDNACFKNAPLPPPTLLY